MLGMWCVLLALFLTRLIKSVGLKQKVNRRCWIGLFLITSAGTLTHYYFLIFAFFSCFITFIVLLFKKEWKKSLYFVISELGGVILAYICFPSMKKQILSGYRGKEAFNNFFSGGKLGPDFKYIASIVGNELFNGWAKRIALVCAIILAAAILIRLCCIKRKKDRIEEPGLSGDLKYLVSVFALKRSGTVIILGVACLLNALVICKIAPYRADRYYFDIYPILVMTAVYLLYLLGKYVLRKKYIADIAVFAVVVVVSISGFCKQEVHYLYTNYSQRIDSLSEYIDYPVVVVNLASYYSAPDAYLYEYEKFDAVFRGSYKEGFESLPIAAETGNLEDGFLIYAVSSKLSDEEFMENVSQYINISDWRLVTNIGTHVYFCECGN